MNPINRQLSLVALLEQEPLSIDEIIPRLYRMGFDITIRTFHRDKEALANQYQIEIIYDKDISKYTLGQSVISSTLRLKIDVLRFQQLLYKHVNLDTILFPLDHSILRWSSVLESVIEASLSMRQIKFKVKSKSGKMKSRVGLPLFIKCFESNYYVWIHDLQGKKDKLYDINTLSQVEASAYNETWPKQVYNQVFEGEYGMDISDKEIERITLMVNSNKVDRVSQEFKNLIVAEKKVDEEPYHLLSILAKPSDSLLSKLVEIGSIARVKKPKWLRKEIKTRLMESLHEY